MSKTVVRGGQVLDPHTMDLHANETLVIEDGTIVDSVNAADAVSDAGVQRRSRSLSSRDA